MFLVWDRSLGPAEVNMTRLNYVCVSNSKVSRISRITVYENS